MAKSFLFAIIAVTVISVAFAQGAEPSSDASPETNPEPMPAAIPAAPQPHPNPNPNPSDLPAPEPVTPEPMTPEPVTPEPVTPEPVTPEPMTPEPVTPEPMTPEPVTPEPVTPEPVTPEPVTPQAVCTGETYGIFQCVDGVLVAKDVAVLSDQLWSGDRYELTGTTIINATLTLSGSDVMFWGDVALNGRLNYGISAGVTVNNSMAIYPAATLVINYTEPTFTPIVVSGNLLVDGALIMDFDKAPMSPRVSIFTDSVLREGDFATSTAMVAGAAVPCLSVIFDDPDSVVSVTLECIVPSPLGNDPVPEPDTDSPAVAPVVAPVNAPVVAPVNAPVNAPIVAPVKAPVKAPAAPNPEPHPAPNPNPEPAPQPNPVPTTNVTDWSAVTMEELLKHVNDTLRNLTIPGINDRIPTIASVVVLSWRINTNLSTVEFQMYSDPKNSTQPLIEGLVNVLKNVSNVPDNRLGNATVVPPTAKPAPAPVTPEPVAPVFAPTPVTVAPEPVTPQPKGPAPHPAPNPKPEMPAPQPADVPSAAQRRSISDNVNDNENDWSDSYYVQVQLVNVPAAPAPKSGLPISLIVILGVITVVALIITVVLVITLNRKKHDDYMPVEDLEDDRLLTDTY